MNAADQIAELNARREQQAAAHLAGMSRAGRRNLLLHLLTPDQRATYFLAHPADAERVRRANEKRERKGLRATAIDAEPAAHLPRSG